MSKSKLVPELEKHVKDAFRTESRFQPEQHVAYITDISSAMHRFTHMQRSSVDMETGRVRPQRNKTGNDFVRAMLAPVQRAWDQGARGAIFCIDRITTVAKAVEQAKRAQRHTKAGDGTVKRLDWVLERDGPLLRARREREEDPVKDREGGIYGTNLCHLRPMRHPPPSLDFEAWRSGVKPKIYQYLPSLPINDLKSNSLAKKHFIEEFVNDICDFAVVPPGCWLLIDGGEPWSEELIEEAEFPDDCPRAPLGEARLRLSPEAYDDMVARLRRERFFDREQGVAPLLVACDSEGRRYVCHAPLFRNPCGEADHSLAYYVDTLAALHHTMSGPGSTDSESSGAEDLNVPNDDELAELFPFLLDGRYRAKYAPGGGGEDQQELSNTEYVRRLFAAGMVGLARYYADIEGRRYRNQLARCERSTVLPPVGWSDSLFEVPPPSSLSLDVGGGGASVQAPVMGPVRFEANGNVDPRCLARERGGPIIVPQYPRPLPFLLQTGDTDSIFNMLSVMAYWRDRNTEDVDFNVHITIYMPKRATKVKRAIKEDKRNRVLDSFHKPRTSTQLRGVATFAANISAINAEHNSWLSGRAAELAAEEKPREYIDVNALYHGLMLRFGGSGIRFPILNICAVAAMCGNDYVESYYGMGVEKFFFGALNGLRTDIVELDLDREPFQRMTVSERGYLEALLRAAIECAGGRGTWAELEGFDVDAAVASHPTKGLDRAFDYVYRVFMKRKMCQSGRVQSAKDAGKRRCETDKTVADLDIVFGNHEYIHEGRCAARGRIPGSDIIRGRMCRLLASMLLDFYGGVNPTIVQRDRLLSPQVGAYYVKDPATSWRITSNIGRMPRGHDLCLEDFLAARAGIREEPLQGGALSRAESTGFFPFPQQTITRTRSTHIISDEALAIPFREEKRRKAPPRRKKRPKVSPRPKLAPEVPPAGRRKKVPLTMEITPAKSKKRKANDDDDDVPRAVPGRGAVGGGDGPTVQSKYFSSTGAKRRKLAEAFDDGGGAGDDDDDVDGALVPDLSGMRRSTEFNDQ